MKAYSKSQNKYKSAIFNKYDSMFLFFYDRLFEKVF